MIDQPYEHLTLEMISEVLEEPELHPEAAEHLAACDVCSLEHSLMRRTLMALSGLGEMDPPADEWERVEARLPTKRHVIPMRPLHVFLGWPAQVAAAMILFAGGILAGLTFMGGGPDDAATLVANGESLPSVGDPVRGGPETRSPFALAQYYEAVAGLEQLRARRVGFGELLEDPMATGERLARLDGLIEASREALASSPTDPAINNLLFDLIKERDDLSVGLESAVRLAGLDYR
ncbi:MAG: hypothetical protein O7E50_00800 [Gemmatimonadetes bacterium]|nr:hypothetical protein [Gemmatimonadota bacterium]